MNPETHPNKFRTLGLGDTLAAGDVVKWRGGEKDGQWLPLNACWYNKPFKSEWGDRGHIYRPRQVNSRLDKTIKILSGKIIELTERLRTRKNNEKALIKGMGNLLKAANNSEQKQFSKGEMVGTLEVIKEKAESLFK